MGLLPQGSRADPRLTGYVMAAFVSVVASILTGRAEVGATAAPFAVLAVLGLVDRRAPAMTGRMVLQDERVLEGDEVHGQVQLEWSGVAELDVIVTPLPGVDLVEPAPVLGWALPATRGPLALGFTVKARAWGRHTLGQVHVRARRKGGLAVWEEVVATGAPLRVLPSPLRLDRLLRPFEPRAVSGAHVSRHRGGGTDFADLRPYVAGDRLRDLSWAATARAGEPWVSVHHPERTGTLVLLVDAAIDGSAPSNEALARTARTAWAVAENHLRHQDRVGLLALVGGTIWLDPRGGRRGRWQLLDALLSVGAMAEDRRLRARWRGRAPRSRRRTRRRHLRPQVAAAHERGAPPAPRRSPGGCSGDRHHGSGTTGDELHRACGPAALASRARGGTTRARSNRGAHRTCHQRQWSRTGCLAAGSSRRPPDERTVPLSTPAARTDDPSAQPTVWPRHRLVIAAAAVVAALLAGAVALGAASTGDTEAAALTGLFGVAFAAVTLLAVIDPRATVAVPVVSLLVVWTVVARSDDPGWWLVPILSLAVAAAELAGLAARLGIVVPRDVVDGGRQVLLHVVLAAGVTAVALLAGRLDGPSGLVATATAMLGCVALAALVAYRPEPSR